MKQKKAVAIGNVGDVDLRLLRVFKTVVECRGMASAELELNVSMSTISRHIKDLEMRLGLVLCRRGRGGFALTPEGTQVYDAALNVLAATEMFRGRLHDIHHQLGGDLHVAIFEKTISNPAARVTQALARFHEQVPSARLHLHGGTIGTIERGVIDGHIDLGIIPEHRSSELLSYRELFEESMYLYAGIGHPWFAPIKRRLDWQHLRSQKLAALGYHSPNMNLAHIHGLDRAATASDQEAVAMLIMTGAFVGFLPDHYAERWVADGKMRAVAPNVFRYSCRFSAILRQSPAPARLTKAFYKLLCDSHTVTDAPAQ